MQEHTDTVTGSEADNALGGKKFLDHVKLASRHHAGLPVPSKHRPAFHKDA